jgi:hypothetical protein
VTAMVADGFTRASAADRKVIIISKVNVRANVVNSGDSTTLSDGIAAP